MFFLNMKDTESLLSLFNDLIGGLVIIYERPTATNQYASTTHLALMPSEKVLPFLYDFFQTTFLNFGNFA